jgi:hypothetical protein
MVIDSTGLVGIGTSTPTFKLDVTGTARLTGQLTGATANFSGNAAFGTTKIALGGSGGFGGSAGFWLEGVSNNFTINSSVNGAIEFLSGSGSTNSYTGQDNAVARKTATTNFSAGITSYYNQYKSVLNATGNAFANTLYVRGFFVDAGTITPNSTTVIPIGFENVSGTNLLNSTSGSTLIGGQFGTLNASSKLQVNSTTQGVLIPRMSTSDKNAIASPATGLQVYDNTNNTPNYYTGTSWANMGSSVYKTSVTTVGTSENLVSGKIREVKRLIFRGSTGGSGTVTIPLTGYSPELILNLTGTFVLDASFTVPMPYSDFQYVGGDIVTTNVNISYRPGTNSIQISALGTYAGSSTAINSTYVAIIEFQEN